MARAFIIVYVLMGINQMSVSVHVQKARAVDLTGHDTMTFSVYTELPTNNSRNTRAVVSREPGSCGWYVELSGSTDIVYKIPDGVQHVSCIWVVWAKTSGPILVRNVDNSQAQFDSSFRLTLEKNFTKSMLTLQTTLPLGSEDMVYFSYPDFNFFYVFFNGNPTSGSQGVHLKLSDSGSKTQIGFRPTVKFIQVNGRSGEFKFPPGNTSTYDSNTRLFLIGYIPEGRHHDSSIKCDLEMNSDFFLLSWQSETTNENSTFIYTGNKTDPGRTLPHGKSYIMAFISDESGVRSGVSISYSINDDNAEWQAEETGVMISPRSKGHLNFLPNFIMSFMFLWSKIYAQFMLLK